MKISYGEKHIVNIGNYENITIEISVEDNVDFENGETLDEARECLQEYVEKVINQRKEKIKQIPNIKAKLQQIG